MPTCILSVGFVEHTFTYSVQILWVEFLHKQRFVVEDWKIVVEKLFLASGWQQNIVKNLVDFDRCLTLILLIFLQCKMGWKSVVWTVKWWTYSEMSTFFKLRTSEAIRLIKIDRAWLLKDESGSKAGHRFIDLLLASNQWGHFFCGTKTHFKPLCSILKVSSKIDCGSIYLTCINQCITTTKEAVPESRY